MAEPGMINGFMLVSTAFLTSMLGSALGRLRLEVGVSQTGNYTCRKPAVCEENVKISVL